MTDPNDKAFHQLVRTDDVYASTHGHQYISGLTKREWFAALAMQGILSSHYIISEENRYQLSAVCLKYADALIEELSK